MTANDWQQRHEWVLTALEKYEVRLTRFAARLLAGDMETARDVVQHVFLRLCEQKPEQLDGRRAAWLFRVCRNRAFDVLRRNGRGEVQSDETSDPPVGREADPADSASTGELSGLLRQLVERLPAAQREAVDLWCEGFSGRQIAEITGRSQSAVRVLVHRALTSLREHPRTRSLLDGSPNENGSPTKKTHSEKRHEKPTQRIP